MRHYRHTKSRASDRRGRSHILRTNPLKPKLLRARLEELVELGLSPEHLSELNRDLSESNVNPANAIYVLEWWKARLSLLLFLDGADIHGKRIIDEKLYNAYLDTLQRYAFKYKLSAHDLALDGELQIDYWGELQHFIQMSGVNPYFKAEWPVLHKITAELRRHRYGTETERVVWLGKLVKENTKLSAARHGFPNESPAIKLLRGAYIGDPTGAEEHTELPKEAIVLTEETFRPSDVIEFLKDAEENLQMSTYFIPKYHVPFLSFPDGKVWTVISHQDRENEKKSLGDCATGEYTDSSIIVISLREPIMESPQGTYYRTRLRAEIVFPRNIASEPSYEQFSKSIGVINQLRGSANSRPAVAMHKYIIPLLEQPWVAHLIRPEHRPDDIFWINDLTIEEQAYLRDKNPKLFDAKAFYEEIKNLDFPKRLETKIIEGIDFPTSYIVEVLADIAAQEFATHGGTPRAGIVTRTLKRRLEDKAPDPELHSLLQAAEASLVRLQSRDVAHQYLHAGFELSLSRVKEIIEQIPLPEEGSLREPAKDPLLDLACHSLAKKLERKEEGLESLENIVRERLIAEQIRHPRDWPPASHNSPTAASLLTSGVTLRPDQIVTILQEYQAWVANTERSGSRKYIFHLALKSIEELSKHNQDLSKVVPILEALVLQPEMKYSIVQEILQTDTVELTEGQICDLLSADPLLPGRTLTALLSLKNKIDDKTLVHPGRTLKIARQAMFRLKEPAVISETLPWMAISQLSVRSIIKVIAAPKMHSTIRNTAFEAIRLKITNGDAKIRDQAFRAVKELLLRTKDKSFIRQLLAIYDGHQHQYRLFYKFLVSRIDWLTLAHNRTFVLSLISNSLPKDKSSYRYTNALPKPLYQLLRRIVADDMIEDNCSFLLQILFDVKFNEPSLKAVRALLEVILDAIIKDPKKLTRTLCRWYQEMPKGWGATEHKTFANQLALTPKLLRQFLALLKITQETGNDCYLDLAVTISQAMTDTDKKKLNKLAVALVKGVYARTGGIRYKDYLDKFLPRRLARRRK